jgi:hypothetical protein
MFLLLHAFYVSALVGLVFPLTALDIRLCLPTARCTPRTNPTLLKQLGGASSSPHLVLVL